MAVEGTTGKNMTVRWKDGGWQMLLVLCLLLLAYAPTIYWLWGRWTMSVWHHVHGLLIPPIVGYLVWQTLRDHPVQSVAANPWGFAIIVPALALLALDAGIQSQLLSALSLVMILPGLSLLFLGTKRTKSILLPLLFLLFMLPIPLAFTGPLHMILREIATHATSSILPYLGIPVYTEATTLHVPAGALEVADACSGFSTLYASVVLACLLAYMGGNYFRGSIIVIAAVPIAIGANIIRVIFLVALVEWRGTGILETSMHTISGLMTFALALPAMFYLDQLLSHLKWRS